MRNKFWIQAVQAQRPRIQVTRRGSSRDNRLESVARRVGNTHASTVNRAGFSAASSGTRTCNVPLKLKAPPIFPVVVILGAVPPDSVKESAIMFTDQIACVRLATPEGN